MESTPVAAGPGIPAHQAVGTDLPAEATNGSQPASEAMKPPHGDESVQGSWAGDLLARMGVPIAGGVTAVTARSPWLLLAITAYSALVDPASPLSRTLGYVLEPAAVALGEALSARIRRWGAGEQRSAQSLHAPATPESGNCTH